MHRLFMYVQKLNKNALPRNVNGVIHKEQSADFILRLNDCPAKTIHIQEKTLSKNISRLCVFYVWLRIKPQKQNKVKVSLYYIYTPCE